MSYRQSATPARDWAPSHTVLMGLGLPADDARMVRRMTTIQITYQPHGVSSEQATRAADQLLAAAQSKFAGNTVRKIGSNGWVSDGRVGYEVILAAPVRAGEINQKAFLVGQIAGPRVAVGSSFDHMRAPINAADFEAEAEGSADGSALPGGTTVVPDPAATIIAEPGFFDQEAGGIPVWMLGGLGVVAVIGLGTALLWPKKSASTANRRRGRRSRRRSRRNSRRGVRGRQRRNMSMTDRRKEIGRAQAKGGPFTIRYGLRSFGSSSLPAYVDDWWIDGSGNVTYKRTEFVSSLQRARDVAGRVVMMLRKAGYKAHLGHVDET